MKSDIFPFKSEKEFNNPKTRKWYMVCYKAALWWLIIWGLSGVILDILFPTRTSDIIFNYLEKNADLFAVWPLMIIALLGLGLQISRLYLVSLKTYSVVKTPNQLVLPNSDISGWPDREPDTIVSVQPPHLATFGFDVYTIKQKPQSQNVTFFVHALFRNPGISMLRGGSFVGVSGNPIIYLVSEAQIHATGRYTSRGWTNISINILGALTPWTNVQLKKKTPVPKILPINFTKFLENLPSNFWIHLEDNKYATVFQGQPTKADLDNLVKLHNEGMALLAQG